jgi:hypothetical protein
MGNITTLVRDISIHMSDALTTAGFDDFADGYILLGKKYLAFNTTPPKVVFVPVGSVFGAKDVYNKSNLAGYPSAEIDLQNQLKSLATDTLLFDVYFWCDGYHNDFDITKSYVHQLYRSCYSLINGAFKFTSGTFEDQKPGQGNNIRLGHQFKLRLEINSPVVDQLLEYAPSDVSDDISTLFTFMDGYQMCCCCF